MNRKPPLSPERRAARAKYAASVQHLGPDHPTTVALRERIDELRQPYVVDDLARQIAAEAPRLTDGQRARLRDLIGTVNPDLTRKTPPASAAGMTTPAAADAS